MTGPATMNEDAPAGARGRAVVTEDRSHDAGPELRVSPHGPAMLLGVGARVAPAPRTRAAR